ncbi:hypothetical protein NLG97_g897 [Lecanicillium saksenae]|uniref:Uncharacterized protein n=1 Tax=Lecanicillium saksenae TaxID=468837 RepID=A0ACC1R713_9HYPO|nr:hypothetical protein NLG97_g897 [Lecanicillium saksenae]
MGQGPRAMPYIACTGKRAPPTGWTGTGELRKQKLQNDGSQAATTRTGFDVEAVAWLRARAQNGGDGGLAGGKSSSWFDGMAVRMRSRSEQTPGNSNGRFGVLEGWRDAASGKVETLDPTKVGLFNGVDLGDNAATSCHSTTGPPPPSPGFQSVMAARVGGEMGQWTGPKSHLAWRLACELQQTEQST